MITIRAPKTSQNRDDFRVLMAGILVTIFLIVAKPYLLVFIDRDLVESCPPSSDSR